MKLLKHILLLMILLFIASVSFAEYGAISVTVKDSEGNGISNLRINIVALTGENDLVADLSFSESLIWNTLDSGFYKIHIFAKDAGYKDEWYNNKVSYDIADIIEIKENETTSIEWTLEELGSGQISGQIVNQLNEGVFFSVLSLYSSDQILIDEVTTNSSGEFSFTGLSDDSYRMYIWHPGKCFEDTWYNNRSNFAAADFVKIENENSISNLSIVIDETNNCADDIIPGIIQAHLPDNEIDLFWFSYVPESLVKSTLGYILLTTHGHSFEYQDTIKAQRNYIAGTSEKTDQMHIVRLGVAIPRSRDPNIGPVTFDYKCFDKQTDPFYQRPDLKINLMIDKLISKLQQKGYNINNKILIEGFSATGSFSYDYCFFQPERVAAIAAGSPGGHLIIPDSMYKENVLNYPLGINNFVSLTGYGFDKESFMKVPKFIYWGDEDTMWYNDNVSYGSYWPDNSMVDFLNNSFGDTLPVRMTNMSNYLIQQGCNLEYKIYSGVGHEWDNQNMRDDVYAFLEKYITIKETKAMPWIPLLLLDD